MIKVFTVFLFVMCSHVVIGAVTDSTSATTTFSTLSFNNFGKAIHLTREGKENIFRVHHNGLYVQLFPSLVVKANGKIKQHVLLAIDPRITEVKPLFVVPTYTYYHVFLKEINDIPSAMKALLAYDGVELVQPDLLQLGDKPPVSNSSLVSNAFYELPTKSASLLSFMHAPGDTLESSHPYSGDRTPGRGMDRRYNRYLAAIGVSGLWAKTKGEGVKIAVIDDGFNLNHPALQHVNTSFKYDVQTQTLTFGEAGINAEHGTRVLGVIWASHFSKDYTTELKPALVGGIAPEAELIALRHSDTRTSKLLLAFHLANIAGADIINCSWHSHWLTEPTADAIKALSLYGRSGKGTAVIFSAGNSGKVIMPQSTEASVPQAIVVSAGNMRFVRLKNSNFGESVDLRAYGAPVRALSIDGGYVRFASTSLAAAVTSGLAALLLSQEPELTLAELEGKLQTLTRPIVAE